MKEIASAWSHLPSGGRVFLAVSGGLDSMTLLEAAFRFRARHDRARPLIVLHVNHGLRGEESDGDETLVAERAQELGLPFVSTRLEWKKKPSQAHCREKRLAFFRSQLAPDDRIFFAHHRDDQAETILLRLLRGSGVRGLAGMKESAGPVLRPFLALGRADILALATQWGVRWREDSSNEKTVYERNWMRHEILPRLEARRPGVAARLAALASEIQKLPLAETGLTGFDSGEGWSLYREVNALDDRSLSRAFGLSRQHTRGLRALLVKGAGAYAAQGRMFRLSAGVLLAGELPARVALERGENHLCLESALGRWTVPTLAGERVGLQAELGLGDKAKKLFQCHRVPIFFRPLLPLLVKAGRPEVLLPAPRPRHFSYEFSPAARWWVTPSVASDGPAVATSRGKSPPER